MNRIKFFLKNERGFLMLDVIFLTLITAFAAMILLNAAPRVKNPQTTLRTTALWLAEEQFAYLESAAAVEKVSPANSTSTKNFDGKDYQIKTEVDGANPYKVTVKISWTVDGKNFEIESERTIWVAKENS